MFNTQCGNGVAVMNYQAQRLWAKLDTPFDISKRTEEKTILNIAGLFTAGLLKPVNERLTLSTQTLPQIIAWLNVTDACNLHCDYCYMGRSSTYMDKQVGVSAINTVIKLALCEGSKQLKLKFAGGEPTLVLPNVLALHDYAVTKGIYSGIEVQSVILSNGVNLDDAAINQLKARNIRIMISLDGVGKYHDAQRRFADGHGSFAYVDRTIQKLIATDHRPMISITISNRNAAGLAEVTQYVLERNLPFSFNFFRDNPQANSSPDLRPQNERLIAALLQAFEVIASSPPNYSLMSAMIDRTCFSHPHHRACDAGESYFAVDTQGNIAKCPMLLDTPVTSIYAEDPLSDLHNDRRTLQQLDVDDKEECQDCKWRYWCAGGCPLLTYRATGRYDAKSPYCEVYKAVFPELLRLEGLRIMKKAGIL